MNEICKLVRNDLELYADGELFHPRSLRRMRRHLDRCAACRFRLFEIDVTMRGVLSDLAPAEVTEDWRGFSPGASSLVDSDDSRRRRARILSGLDDLAPPLFDTRASHARADHTRASYARAGHARLARSAFRSGFAAAAMLLLSVGLGWWLHSRSVESPVNEYASGTPDARAVFMPLNLSESSETMTPSLNKLLWFARHDDERTLRSPGRSASSTASTSRLWFYGAPRDSSPGSARRAVLAMEVEVSGPSWPDRERVYLIATDDSASAEDTTRELLVYEVVPSQLRELTPALSLHSASLRSARSFRIVPVRGAALRIPGNVVEPGHGRMPTRWVRYGTSSSRENVWRDLDSYALRGGKS